MMSIKEALQRAREVESDATPGEMIFSSSFVQSKQMYDGHRPNLLVFDHDARPEDLRFIAFSRNVFKTALDVIEAAVLNRIFLEDCLKTGKTAPGQYEVWHNEQCALDAFAKAVEENVK